MFFHTQKQRVIEKASPFILFTKREKKKETNRYLEKKSDKGFVNATVLRDCAAATRRALSAAPVVSARVLPRPLYGQLKPNELGPSLQAWIFECWAGPLLVRISSKLTHWTDSAFVLNLLEQKEMLKMGSHELQFCFRFIFSPAQYALPVRALLLAFAIRASSPYIHKCY